MYTNNFFAVTALLTLILSGSGLAFRFGFGRLSSVYARKRVSKCSTVQIENSLLPGTKVIYQFGKLIDPVQQANLNSFAKEFIDVVLPAIKTSPFLQAKDPDLLNSSVQTILGGLPDVTDIEYLNTLPVNDPRRHLLATIQDPGPERRAELMENLQVPTPVTC